MIGISSILRATAGVEYPGEMYLNPAKGGSRRSAGHLAPIAPPGLASGGWVAGPPRAEAAVAGSPRAIGRR
jgi:hypothetical protein